MASREESDKIWAKIKKGLEELTPEQSKWLMHELGLDEPIGAIISLEELKAQLQAEEDEKNGK